MGPRCEGKRSRSKEPTVGVLAADPPWPAPKGNKMASSMNAPRIPRRERKGESEADETGGRQESTPSRSVGHRERDERHDEERGLLRRESQPSHEPGAPGFPSLRQHGGSEKQRQHGDIDAAGREE